MKTRNYIIAIVSFFLVSTMIWMSCEKQDNTVILDEANQSIDFEVPADVAVYFTPAQINSYYDEVEKEKSLLPPGYDFIPVMIKMENSVHYLRESGYEYGIQFEGTGEWNEQGAIRYFERVLFLKGKPANDHAITGSKGEGTIFMQKGTETEDKILPREDLLAFESKDRKEIRIIPRPEDVQACRDKMYKSKIYFNGGYGLFDEAYGNATKVEFHYANQPEICNAAILGYVFVKQEAPKDPDS